MTDPQPEPAHERRVVLAGAGGFIGRPLAAFLERSGFQVIRLARPGTASVHGAAAPWNPSAGELDPDVLDGADAVVNLAGSNIAARRWNRRVKRDLWESRTSAAATLVRALSQCHSPPPVLVNASAVGYYGSRGDRELAEDAPRGDGYLARVAEAWEAEARRAEDAGARVALARFGMVLGDGGALAKMLKPFRLGLGGPLGSGRQWWSWVAMDDVVAAVEHAIDDDRLSGPFNVVAPRAVTCRDFTRALGRALHRPAKAPVPAPALRLALGEMADELLLASTRAVPAALTTAGYGFRRPGLDDVLADLGP